MKKTVDHNTNWLKHITEAKNNYKFEKSDRMLYQLAKTMNTDLPIKY